MITIKAKTYEKFALFFAKRACCALFATIITAAALSQTAPSTWDTLPWKNYADFKILYS
ncbi:MAG: hypothetical protein WKG06_00635 [Segetibacter sp.]